ncbi:hypothetical protein FS837_007479, partial [Tulasnella sp. UAMH 9824]
MDYMSQLPIELLAHVISLSLDTPTHGDRPVRAETLRLVNKTWRAAIDSTPGLWACIPNARRYSMERLEGWIQKSGQVPLHIFSLYWDWYSDEYMQLVVPHIHRWRKLEIGDWGVNVWRYFSEPSPMLEELLITNSRSPPEHIPFKDITSSLYSVEVVRVTIWENIIIFLRNQKELRLESIGYY